jgi:hypothetical protein
VFDGSDQRGFPGFDNRGFEHRSPVGGDVDGIRESGHDFAAKVRGKHPVEDADREFLV